MMTELLDDRSLVFGIDLEACEELTVATSHESLQQSKQIWLHLCNIDDVIESWLQHHSALDPDQHAVLFSEADRPRFFPNNDDLLLVFRAINCNPGSDPEDMVALHIYASADLMISIRLKKVIAVQDTKKALLRRGKPTRTGEVLASICEKIADRISDTIESMEKEADDLEDQVVNTESRLLRVQLAAFRRKTITLRRFLAPQREMFAHLAVHSCSWLLPEDHRILRESSEMITKACEDLDSLREHSVITQEELASRLGERMERITCLLTIVATIFLPLGFLTGLMGINLGGMPGAKDSHAFWIFCGLLAAILTVELAIFRKNKWL